MLHSRICIWLLVLILGSVSGAIAQAPTSLPEDTVRVSVRVNTWYDDSPNSIQEIANLLEFFPPERDAITAGETVNLFIIRRYRFGPSQLPKTYDLIQKHICNINEIANDTTPLAAREILAPPLPRRARPRPQLTNPYNALPKIATFRTMSAAGELEVQQTRATEDFFREGSRQTILNVDLPRAAVEAKRETALFRSSDLRITSGLVQLQMQPAACNLPPGVTTFPDAATRIAVAKATSKPRLRPSYLFVLDSGWPDEPSYRDSVAAIERALLDLRQKNHLTPYVRRKPAKFIPLDPAKHSLHVGKVASAIAPLRTLDTSGQVRVIYLPLSLDQGDEDLYRNLFETYHAYVWSNSLNATTPAGVALTEPVLQQEAAASADAILKRMKFFAPPGEFYTDHTVLEAVYMLGDALATTDDTSYVVNHSWTVAGGLLKFLPPPSSRGITVAAAGNNDNDFVAMQTDFARQAVTSDLYLAVMNISSTGAAQCKSSSFDVNRFDDVRVVGFDGNIPGDSGTSFAAPRVAWLIALRETITASPAPAFWATDIAKTVKGVRNKGNPPWQNVWFDVGTYLSK